MTNRIIRAFFLMAPVLVTCLWNSQSSATESGTQHYPIGANTAQPAIMPPPGETYWLNYDQFYTAGEYMNGQGKSSIAGYHISTFGEAARFIHTWDIDLYGWHLSTQMIATLVHTDLWRGTTHNNGTGFGDLNAVPLYVSKDFGTFNVLAGFDIWAPTGNYNKSLVVNESLNYATFAPEVALTYHPNDRFMANIDAIAMFNTEDPTTRYFSGSAINFDYQAGYRLFDNFKALQVGFSGYYFAQFTGDLSDGVPVAGGGNRGRVLGIGPQVRFDLPTGGGIIFKWQKEMAVMNRPEGDRFWCQFALKL